MESTTKKSQGPRKPPVLHSGMSLEEVAETAKLLKKDKTENINTNERIEFHKKIFKERKVFVFQQLNEISENRKSALDKYQSGKIYLKDYQKIIIKCNDEEEKLLNSISIDNQNVVLDDIFFQKAKYETGLQKKYNGTLSILLKSLLVIIVLVILFIYALNGRYEVLGDARVMDKWKKEVYINGSKELPIIRNEQVINR